MCPPIELWFRAFLLTVAIEVPIVLLLSRGSSTTVARRAAIVLFAQLITHPLVWYVFPSISGITGHTALVLAEVWAWLGEAAFYALVLTPLRPARALGISGIANGVSFGLGLILFA